MKSIINYVSNFIKMIKDLPDEMLYVQLNNAGLVTPTVKMSNKEPFLTKEEIIKVKSIKNITIL